MSSDLVSQVLQTIGAIGAAVLVPLVSKFLFQQIQKLGMTLDANQQAKVEYFVQQAVIAAEEWGAARVKAKVPTTGADKMKTAIASVTAKIPGVTADEAATLINAALPKLQLGASDFLKSLQTAATSGAQ